MAFKEKEGHVVGIFFKTCYIWVRDPLGASQGLKLLKPLEGSLNP
jgi:hypothetical protein